MYFFGENLMPKNKGGWQEIDEEKQSECMNLHLSASNI